MSRSSFGPLLNVIVSMCLGMTFREVLASHKMCPVVGCLQKMCPMVGCLHKMCPLVGCLQKLPRVQAG